MKNAILSFALFLSLVFIAAFEANAQTNPKFRIAEDRTDAQGNLMQAYFRTENQAPTLEEALTELKQRNHLDGRNELRLVSKQTDELGMTHYHYQQYFAGVMVDMAEYLFHEKNGKVLVMNGEAVGVPEETPTAALVSHERAFDLAVNQMGAQKYSWQAAEKNAVRSEKPEPKLVILRKPGSRDAASSFQLTYRVDVTATDPVGKKAIYINARKEKVETEQVLMADGCVASRDHTTESTHKDEHMDGTGAAEGGFYSGSGQTRYSGTRSFETSLRTTDWLYTLNDQVRKVHTVNLNYGYNETYFSELVDNDNTWLIGENGINNDIALDAHWATELSIDFFRDRFNRNSYDDLGSPVNVYVHYGNHYDNAKGGDGKILLGDGGERYRPLVSLDVVAHEFGHSVCQQTANLVYQGESGALNEAFSDIWGACVESYYAPEKNRWLIGEEISLNTAALRSMSNPNALGQPDTYNGTFWYTGFDDNGGVHYNSGVLNYWFYLLAQGGSGTNDFGVAFSVAGIGITKAAKIAYYMERYLLTSTSQYSYINPAAQVSAMVLYGYGSAEYQAVEDALDAVGLGGYNYCVSKGQSTQFEYIQKVALNGVEVNSGNDGGYGNHTNSIFTVTQGNLYTMELTPGFPSTPYQEAWQVWIDLNRDGQFSDNEAIVGVSGSSAVSATVYIPVMQQYGATRMRVAMSYYNPVSSPCSTFETGEVEDFTVNILKNTCTSASNNNSYEYIKFVAITGGVINASGADANGYGDYTNYSVTSNNNTSHAIVVRPGFSGDSYPEYWKAWIDYNGDGNFDNATEMILDLYGNFYQASRSFSIPNYITGAKRLRICMSYDPISTACMNNAWGETEDYTVFIISNMGIAGNDPTTVDTGSDEDLTETIIDENAILTPRNTMTGTEQVTETASFSLAPNPTTGIVRIQSDMPLNGTVKVEVFATSGQLLQSINLEASNQINESIDLGEQPDGLYLVRLSNGGNCKVKTVVLKK